MASATNKYLIEPDTYELFNNIATFMKNAVVKDSSEDYYNQDDNGYAKDFGNLLIKYFNGKLSNSDIALLIKKVNDYNNAVDTYWKTGDKNLKIWGLTTDSAVIKRNGINTQSCLFRRLVEKYPNSIDDILSLFNLSDSKLVIKSIYKLDEIEADPSLITTKDEEIKETIERIESCIQNKDRIMIHIANDGHAEYAEKRSASANESTWAEKGEYLTFFDLRNIQVLVGDDLSKIDSISSYDSTSNRSAGEIYSCCNILIQYKELNKKYRAALNSNLWDNALSLMPLEDENNELSPAYFYKYDASQSDTIIRADMHTHLRSLSNDGVLLRDRYDSTRYKYFYGNPYIARMAPESSIIGYYYGDDWADLSNGYGEYSYQISEITKFLDIYEETREYYYKVLLNRSFVNESLYGVYEKSFIAFTAIARFMDSKIELLKDVESLNRSDISNLMQTYGLKELDDRLRAGGAFINQEYYLRKILHNFPALIKLKGSKAIIDKLMQIFDYGDDEITINKYLIYDNEFNAADNGIEKTASISDRINFIELPYLSTSGNALKDINDAILTTKTSYASFFQQNSDRYWDTDKVTPQDIINANLSSAETKYLSLKLSENMAAGFVKSRYIFSLFDTGTIDTDKSESLGISNNTAYRLIRLLLTALYSSYANGDTINTSLNGAYWWIDFDTLQKDYGVFKSDDNPSDPDLAFLKTYITVRTDNNVENIISYALEGGQSKCRHFLSEEFSSSSNDNMPENIIRMIGMLYALSNSDLTTAKKIYSTITGSDDSTVSYVYLFIYILDFIERYFDGSLINSDNRNSNYQKFLDIIFSRYFTKNNDGDPLYINKSFKMDADDIAKIKDVDGIKSILNNVLTISETDNTITLVEPPTAYSTDELSTALIYLINSVREDNTTQTELQLKLSLNESISRELDFMSAAINYFISYTTQVINSQFIRAYSTESECLLPTDNIDIIQKDVHSEMTYYDEEFTITEKGGE